jgi:hypothetical protein
MNISEDEQVKACTCTLQETLRVLWLTKKLFDVYLIVEEQYRFDSHKIALLAHCSRIQDILLKSNTDEIIEITLFNATHNGITLVLSYIYKLEISFDIFNFADIFISALELGIIDLIEMCQNYVENNMQFLEDGGGGDNNFNSKNNIGILTRALEILKPLKTEKFYEIFLSYISKNLKCCFNTQEFLIIDFSIFIELLRRYSLARTNKNDVLNAIYRWICYDKINRYKYHAVLIKSSGFNYSSSALIDLQKKLLQKDAEFSKRVKKYE